jgi:plasmid stabilization system protein ParE
MEVEIRKVVISDFALLSIENIFQYGIETFSFAAASIFIEELGLKIQSLSFNYNLHPECRFLKTKNKLYRNIILGNDLIIFRITLERIEVLNVIHGSRSVNFIKSTKGIKI